MEIEDFCNLLKTENHSFRLPSEAEWNSAASFPYKSSQGVASWHSGNSGGTTMPVGKAKPNSLGIHDLYGNVWEWCAEQHDGKQWRGSPNSEDYLMIKGGSWRHPPDKCKQKARGKARPDAKAIYLGFRLVMEIHPHVF